MSVPPSASWYRWPAPACTHALPDHLKDVGLGLLHIEGEPGPSVSNHHMDWCCITVSQLSSPECSVRSASSARSACISCCADASWSSIGIAGGNRCQPTCVRLPAFSLVQRAGTLVAVVVPVPGEVHCSFKKGVLKGLLQVPGDGEVAVRLLGVVRVHDKGPALRQQRSRPCTITSLGARTDNVPRTCGRQR